MSTPSTPPNPGSPGSGAGGPTPARRRSVGIRRPGGTGRVVRRIAGSPGRGTGATRPADGADAPEHAGTTGAGGAQTPDGTAGPSTATGAWPAPAADDLFGTSLAGREPGATGRTGEGAAVSTGAGPTGVGPTGVGPTGVGPTGVGPTGVGPTGAGVGAATAPDGAEPAASRPRGKRLLAARPRPAARPGPGRTRRSVPTPVIAGAAVVLAAVAVVCAVGNAQLRGSAPARNTALVDVGTTAQVSQQVADDLTKIYSFDYTRLDQNEAAAKAVITPAFDAQFEALFQQVRTLAPQQKAVVTATVNTSAVRSVTGDTAQVLVFLDQQATRAADGGRAQQLAAAGRLTVTAQQVDGTWKVANVVPQ